MEKIAQADLELVEIFFPHFPILECWDMPHVFYGRGKGAPKKVLSVRWSYPRGRVVTRLPVPPAYFLGRYEGIMVCW